MKQTNADKLIKKLFDEIRELRDEKFVLEEKLRNIRRYA